jgi:hypothetical protein
MSDNVQDDTNNDSNVNVEPNKPKRTGRPRGSKDQLGLPLKKRMKALRSIIEDPNAKESDKVQAVKVMTELLADRIQTAEATKDIYLIKFEEVGKNEDIEPISTPSSNNKLANEPPSSIHEQDAKMSQVVGNKDIIQTQVFKPETNVMLNSISQTETQTSSTNETNETLSDTERKIKQAKARLHKLRAIRDARAAPSTPPSNTLAGDLDIFGDPQ